MKAWKDQRADREQREERVWEGSEIVEKKEV
jgi:hypothetical protein